MKLSIAAGLLFCCVGLVFAQSQTVKRLDGSQISVEEIGRVVTDIMANAKVTGLQVSILNNNKTVYTRAYGFRNKETGKRMDTSTVMAGASFSKAVFAFLVLKLVDDGVIDLDKPVYQYLDKPLPDYADYADLSGDDRWKLITPRMCLSHTTGFPNWRFLAARTANYDPHGKLAIYFKPGTKYGYSGEGIKLLQLVIEKVTGRNLEDLASEKIFKPVGMTRTSYVWQQAFEDDYASPHNANQEVLERTKRKKAEAAGSLQMTIEDYSKFIEYVMQDRGLSRKMREAMMSPQIAIHSKTQFPTISDETTTDNDDIHLAYGLGWGVLKCKYGGAFFKEGHDDGWQNYNINFKDKGISIIILTNSDNGESLFKELLEKTIGDIFTPWKWERYTPYDAKRDVGSGPAAATYQIFTAFTS